MNAAFMFASLADSPVTIDLAPPPEPDPPPGTAAVEDNLAGEDQDLADHTTDSGHKWNVVPGSLLIDSNGNCLPQTVPGSTIVATFETDEDEGEVVAVVTNTSGGSWPALLAKGLVVYDQGSNNAIRIDGPSGELATVSVATNGAHEFKVVFAEGAATVYVDDAAVWSDTFDASGHGAIGIFCWDPALNNTVVLHSFSSTLACSQQPVVTLATRAQLEAASLGFWPDGTMGVVGGTLFVAANGSSVGIASGTTSNPISGGGSTTNIGSMKASFDYAAGGKIYDAGGGLLLQFYHAEKWPGGDATKFWSAIGIAKSTNGGSSWVDCGIVIEPTVAYDEEAEAGVEIGGGDPVVNGDYIYCYFNDADAGGQVGLTVARALISEVVAAAANTEVSTWNKYHDGGWTEPGTGGGLSTRLESTTEAISWHDVALFEGEYVLVGTGPGHSLLFRITSNDGLSWSAREVIATEAAEVIYPTLVPKDGELAVWYVSSLSGGFNRWTDAVLKERILS
jgi:hypothetical protein